MIDPQVLTFTGVVALLTITPGADTMLVLRSVLAQGRRAGLLTTLGVCSGLFVHATLSALGLSLILMHSAAAFTAVKWVGAGYLLFLGAQSLWRLRGPAPAHPTLDAAPVLAASPALWSPLLTGVLTNLLNPKVAVFYLAFLPQFIAPPDPILAKSLLLAGIHAALGIVWLSLITLLVSRFRGLVASPAIRRRLEALTGVVLIGFGLRLAAEQP